MKKIKIIYWIFTGLFAAFMIFSSIPDAMSTKEAVEFIHDKMGFPEYIVPFLGIAKFLGAIVILIPGFYRIKEWAYAGLAFDLIGATYGAIALGTPFAQWSFMLLPLTVGAVSYIYSHKLRKAKGEAIK